MKEAFNHPNMERTVKNLRMIHALTGESIVAILDRIVEQELQRVQQEQNLIRRSPQSMIQKAFKYRIYPIVSSKQNLAIQFGLRALSITTIERARRPLLRYWHWLNYNDWLPTCPTSSRLNYPLA